MKNSTKENTLRRANEELGKGMYNVAFWFFQSLAEEGVGEAFFELGRFYKFGWNGEQDDKKAFECFYKGAVRGDSLSQNFLADCYANGIGTTPDPEEAFFWMKESADLNCLFAIMDLGNYYYYGIGVEKNLEKAFEYNLKAADYDSECTARAKNNVAFSYLNGQGVDPDPEKAKLYFQLAINSGCQGKYYLDSTIEGAKNGNEDDKKMLQLCGIEY